jgi:starvation-inducible DNA-binding protein
MATQTSMKGPNAPSGAKSALDKDMNMKNDNESNGARGPEIEPQIGLEPEDMKAEVRDLNEILANYAVFATKAHNYHWNVEGIHFNDLHKFFEKLYEQLNVEIDELAERIRTLGGRPLGTMQLMIDTASLEEETREDIDAIEMLRTVLADEEEIIRQMREIIDGASDEHEDETTADFVNSLCQIREKHAWMTRVMTR